MTVYRRHNAQAKEHRAQRAAAELLLAHDDTTHHAAIAGRVKLTLTEAPMVSDSDETKPAQPQRDPNEQVQRDNDPRARDEAEAKVIAAAAEAKAKDGDKPKDDKPPKGVTKPATGSAGSKDEEISVHGTLTTRRELSGDEEPVTAHDKPHAHDKDAKHKK